MALVVFIYWGVSALGLVALAGGFLGRFYPAGDSLAVFRSQVSVLGAGWALLGMACGLPSGWLLLPCGAAFATIAREHLRRETMRDAPVVHYQKNMSFRMQDTAPLARDIREVAPDLLTLQEVTEDNAELLTSLADILPYQLLCPYEEVGGVAIASRWPFVAGTTCCETHGVAIAQVAAPDGPLWLASVHLCWPWPARPPQAERHRKLLAVLDRVDGPAVLGGDFNMVRWSHVLRSTARAIDAEPGGRVRPSFPLKGVTTLPIDQSLIPRGMGGASEARPLLGSDHKGLVVRY
ncbi:endonuclease/exonuclease/phosphatase (EEP) superfamily protein YafD [Aliiruegeria haliotis]|uniref:Endonuclease/exonuclease/phosphatase (EEP) superfamily protein YafD n=1 Tax=Aliiruegeria haliotis TaxID=1280846 RepID=A0A2T0RYK9_9RHOB|nr:endonuclease/exonuclease/phosphatase family protein [Aliiruegeria haliotis]PRY26269.1 endonuclease/exonuclease/phosphatase (EEP) superfamily protein YafD [Aliiruegeria haliotis]